MSHRLRCIACATQVGADTTRYACPKCGDLLEVWYPQIEQLDAHARGALGRRLLRLFQRRIHSQRLPDCSGVWTYRELFPLIERRPSIVTLGEGRTRLYDGAWMGAIAGRRGRCFVKHEGENPTGSFKDRGMTALISRAVENSVGTVLCASTGNTSASLAKYGKIAGLDVFVLVGSGRISEGKLSQAKAYGATILQIEGDFDLAQAIVKRICAANGRIMLANSLNPYRLEGQKTIIFEMLHQYTLRVWGAQRARDRWAAPAWIVLPGGNLGNTSAFGKALRELHSLDMIDRVPRIAVVQASGANPLERSVERALSQGRAYGEMGANDLVPVEAHTVASAIEIGNPVNFTKALKTLAFTSGVVRSVSDDEILKAKSLIDYHGAGCEPASAASLAGFLKLAQEGTIGDGDDAILLTTGHVLKDPKVNMQGGGMIIQAPGDEEAIRAILEKPGR